MIPDKVCLIPFTSIATHPAGFISRCMMSSTPMGLMTEPNVWDNGKFVQLRTDMVDGIWNLPGCATCHEREKQGLVSQRINWKTNERWWNGDIWDSKNFEHSKTGNNIYHLFLNTSNLCNFKCRMCNSMFSNSWINDDKLLRDNGFKREEYTDYTKNRNDLMTFVTNLLPQLAELRMITVTGGEPFINNDLLDVFDVLDNAGILKNVRLSITTNGSLLTEQHLLRLRNAKSVNINISVDGTGKLFEYMRGGEQCTWEELTNKIDMVCKFRNEYKNFLFSPNASYQIYNMLNVKEFYDWAEPLIRRPDEWIEYRLLTHPEYLHVAMAPDSIKQKALSQIEYVEQKYDPANKFFLENMKKNLAMTKTSTQWQEFKKFTSLLDNKRDQKLRDVCPELYENFTV
jgi:MoaA/NifB/PqqE/SkfB family radical SAM enzyme